MKIVSFNVNSVRMRQHQLQTLVERYQPDIIGLQETKVQDHEFPLADIESLGYKAEFSGQKTHYGVALLYKPELPLVKVQKGWTTDLDDAQRRMIIGDFMTPNGDSLRVLNGYFPQGESRDHPIKFPAKQAFYADLMAYLNNECQPDQKLVLMGDFNISPQDIDIGIGEANRLRWLKTGKTSFLPEEREMWQKLLDWGLYDTYRKVHPDRTDLFSWFDYRSKGFDDDPKRGLRIDTLLATKSANELVTDSGIAYDIRGMEKPSDHAPVWTDFDL
ncbi:MAG: exodeoxyribonuclease III [Thiomicrospira sp.]|uniref:exodeoxyribonuclease III n=1 Tax=Thiomicrospira sp. TaxID=935 RepID=UPI0019DF76A2|nr:exodeoxyribonuclease III [Thiomicrospira sp.]MBE0493823.1 exodeoxyribonuclease III [Thiomicrospira sp.]